MERRQRTTQARKQHQFIVEEGTELLTYLFKQFADKSRSSVKSLLKNRQVFVNGKICTQFNEPLKPGDNISISTEKGATAVLHPQLELVYEDADLLVVNKHHGLLSIATQSVKEKTAYYILNNYVKRHNLCDRVFVLHRLDRETSGVMLFAKNIQTQERLQKNWQEMVLERKYVAVVEGVPEHAHDQISSFLKENEAMNVYSSREGKLAITNYHVLKSNGKYTLVELSLETGRKNQIRIHMADLGHPIAGDAKYGAATNPIQRLALHACQIKFIHPTTRQVMNFQTGIPKRFSLLVKQREK